MSCETDETAELFKTHKSINMSLPDKTGSKIFMVSPIITGLSETKNSDEPSILTRIIAFDEHHDHDVAKVCVMKDENIDVLSTIDDENTDNDAREVPETSSLFDAQSHLSLNLSVTENEDDTSYDENGKFKDKNLKKYDGAISNFTGNMSIH